MEPELRPMPMVLMYHSVEPYESDPYQVTVHPDRFERQLGWLSQRGLRGVSMRELLDARRRGEGAGLVGLTFDDGYLDFVTTVMPALTRYGFTATVYIVAGSLGGSNEWDRPGPAKPLMTAGQVVAAAKAGVEVGSHSMRHIRLSETDQGDLTDQVRRSRAVLVELLGEDVGGFCYPYGAINAREVEAVRAAGYEYACAVYPSELAGRHAIPRTFVGDRDTSTRLLAKWARHRLLRRRGGGS